MFSWLSAWASRIRGLLARRGVDRDFEQELDAHLALLMDENVRRGMTLEEARRAAHVRLGGVAQLRETHRELQGLPRLETLGRDIRYGLRMLRNSPGFTAVAVLTLALGIGANTAVFSVINAVMLRMLPVHDPERLVQVAFQGKHSSQSFVGESFPYPVFEQLRQRNQVFSDVAAFTYWTSFDAHLEGPSPSAGNESIKAQVVTVNFFSLLGVNAVIGRTFAPDEDNGAGAHPVAVISYALWTRLFARDPGALGRKIVIGDLPLTIVGVAPAHFSGVNPGRVCDLWIPVSMQPKLEPGGWLTDAGTNWLTLMARLKPGVSVEQARAGLDVIYQQIQRQQDFSDWSDQDRRDFFTHRIVLEPAARGTDYLRQQFKQPLFLLMAMVGLVLLIACANTANLLLARASARQPEISVRLALGAGPGRLRRQLLTESVLLSFMGAALGVLFAYWGSPLLVILMSQAQNEVRLDVHPDARVLVFTAAVALLTGILFGLVPALRATRIGANPSLRNVTMSRGGRRLGGALVAAQVGLSLVMVIGAGLLVRTFHNLESLDPGFDRHHILLFGFDPTKAGYKDARAAQLREQVLEQVRRIPGVRAASFSFLTPICGGGWDNVARSVEGYTPSPGEDMDIDMNAIGPGFFATLGTPMLRGRDFGPQDHADSPWVALINETMARRFFGNRSPIGKHFTLGPWSGKQGIEIIGVVGDAKYLSLRETTPPTAYLYVPQLPAALSPGGMAFEVNSVVPPLSLVPQLRSVIAKVDSQLTATDIKTLEEQVDQSLYQEKMMSALSSFFGVLALVLACVGLYGVISYGVARRTNEIGIRMALGAERGGILRMVLREALILSVVGIAVGLPAAWIATRSIASLLYGLKTSDPLTIGVATLVMASVALLAGFLPARRATKVDPMVALRYE
jgi:predicted permease